MERTIFFLSTVATPVLRCGRPTTVVRAASGQCVLEISYHSVDGAKSKGPSMSIKFEGKPPFYLGISGVGSRAGRERDLAGYDLCP